MYKRFILFSVFCLMFSSIGYASEKAGNIREPAVAGRFYPGTEKELRKNVNALLSKASADGVVDKPIAIISPHAGYQYSGLVAAHGYKTLKEHKYKRVIVLAPSHRSRFTGASILDVEYYKTPLGLIQLDTGVCNNIINNPPYVGTLQKAHTKEHSLETQLPFLQIALGDFKLVPILIGRITTEVADFLAEKIKPFIDEDTLVIASCDFTHYGYGYNYVPFRKDVKDNIKKLDYGAFERIFALDFDGFLRYRKATRINACGFTPVALLLKLLPGNAKSKLVKYDTSGNITGDFNNSVSYASIVFTKSRDYLELGGAGLNDNEGQVLNVAEVKPVKYGYFGSVRGVFNDMMNYAPTVLAKGEKYLSLSDNSTGLSDSEKLTLLKIARDTLEAYVKEQILPDISSGKYVLTEKLKEKRGVFVTLNKDGFLRGCIGHILPRESLFNAVIKNAVNSSSHDRRFRPVSERELPNIEIDISVLSPLREVSGPDNFIPGEHGILIQLRGMSAVFLPQVATEQGWGKTETLSHLCRKAGLPFDAWKDRDMEFYIFTAQVFHEKDFVSPAKDRGILSQTSPIQG